MSIKVIIIKLISLYAVVVKSDLCHNPTIDSIAYNPIDKMYFITSGGKYYYSTEADLPKLGSTGDGVNDLLSGKPLPHGFKRGDAAVYVDTLYGCKYVKTNGRKRAEQQIWVVELTQDGRHEIIVWDLRNRTYWSEPHSFSDNMAIGRAQVVSTKKIDAIFAYRTTDIYVIQGKSYAIVDIKPYCYRDGFGKAIGRSRIHDFGTDQPIYAMTVVSNKTLVMFHETTYYKLKVIGSDGHQLIAMKTGLGKSIASDFFKFGKECVAKSNTDQVITNSNEEANSASNLTINPTINPTFNITINPTSNPTFNLTFNPTFNPESTDIKTLGGGDGGQLSELPKQPYSDSREGGSVAFIDIVIYVIVVIIIAAIAFHLMRKYNSNAVFIGENCIKAGCDASDSTSIQWLRFRNKC